MGENYESTNISVLELKEILKRNHHLAGRITNENDNPFRTKVLYTRFGDSSLGPIFIFNKVSKKIFFVKN